MPSVGTEVLLFSLSNCKNNKVVYIPQKYGAFVRPIACHALHSQLSQQDKHQYYTVELGKFYSPFKSKAIWQF